MFDISWQEMLVIAIVLIVVVGPKDLPKMLRSFGRTTAKMRSMAGDFRKQFDEALKEAELDDVRNMANEVRKLNPTSDLKKAFDPMRKATQDVRAGLDTAMKPAAKPAPSPEAAKPDAVAKSMPPAKAGAAGMPGDKNAAKPAAKPAAKKSAKASVGAKTSVSARAKAEKPKAGTATAAPAPRAGKAAAPATGSASSKPKAPDAVKNTAAPERKAEDKPK